MGPSGLTIPARLYRGAGAGGRVGWGRLTTTMPCSASASRPAVSIDPVPAVDLRASWRACGNHATPDTTRLPKPAAACVTVRRLVMPMVGQLRPTPGGVADSAGSVIGPCSCRHLHAAAVFGRGGLWSCPTVSDMRVRPPTGSGECRVGGEICRVGGEKRRVGGDALSAGSGKCRGYDRGWRLEVSRDT